MTDRFDAFAIAAPGLEPIVARELAQLGEQPRIEDGGVAWSGDAHSIMRANLWLRTASRVIVRVASFHATAFHQLERAAKKVPWHEYVPAAAHVDFRVTARKSKLYHSDAIAERLRAAFIASRNRKPGAGSREPNAESPESLFIVRVFRDEVTVSVDTSGELLHLRGYRQAVGKAPLRETLGAALLLAAGYDGSAALCDPFCGSGTIPIEGALIARRIAPGIARGFAMERWPGFDAAIARALRQEARSRQLPAAPAPIVGSDRDAGAIAAATANAERAGVAADVALSARALSAMDQLPPASLVATNPPYGVRVSSGADVRNLYAQLGKILRSRAAGSTLAMYVPQAHLASQTRLEPREVYKTSNGGLPVAAVMASVS